VKPLTFVAAVNNEQTLQVTLLSSPCFHGEHPHQLLLTRGAKSAAEVYNAAFDKAEHELIVFLHQDVYLPGNWTELFQTKYAEAVEQFENVGVVGLYGVSEAGRYGRIRTFGVPLFEPSPLPARVRVLDELLLAMPRSSTLRFDPTLGFHLYGSDIALQAEVAGSSVVVVDAEAHHNSITRTLPPAFHTSVGVFAKKWASKLPIHTPCAEIR